MSSTFPCPKCSGEITAVVDTRAAAGVRAAVRRRRRCLACSHRFTTYEQSSEDGGGHFTAQLDALAKQAEAILAQSQVLLQSTAHLQYLSTAWREIEDGRNQTFVKAEGWKP